MLGTIQATESGSTRETTMGMEDGAQAPMISSRLPRGPRLAGIHHITFYSPGGTPQLSKVSLDPENHFAAAWNLSLVMGPGGINVVPLDPGHAARR